MVNRTNTSYRKLTVDQVAHYLSCGCIVFPPIHDFLLDELEMMERRGSACLTPSSIFRIYHRKILRKQDRVA